MLSLILMGVLLAASAYLGVALVRAILGNLEQGRGYRERLAARLARLRLQRALGLFGIDVQHYLHTRPVGEIDRHMRACKGCQVVDRCDPVLERGEGMEGFGHCPNHEALIDLKASQVRDAA